MSITRIYQMSICSRGRVVNESTTTQSVDTNAIVEQAKFSWYDDPSSGLSPSQGVTQPNPGNLDAYSWLKAPRYSGVPH